MRLTLKGYLTGQSDNYLNALLNTNHIQRIMNKYIIVIFYLLMLINHVAHVFEEV